MSKNGCPTSGKKNTASPLSALFARMQSVLTPDSVRIVESRQANTTGDAFDVALANVKFG